MHIYLIGNIGLLILYLVGIIPTKFAFLSLASAWSLFLYLGTRLYSRQKLMNLIIFATSFCLLLAVFDLMLRPLVNIILYHRPHEMFNRRYPRMPVLHRYATNISYDGKTGGDLLVMLGKKAEDYKVYKEARRIRFITDAYGFRNDGESAGKELDLILLGDSFGLGAGVTQGKTWAAILDKKYQLNIYNLSMQPAGPWDELMNLKIEFNRLKTSKKTVLLWAIFLGNDLDDYYGDTLSPQYNNIFKATLVSFSNFRVRSPISRLKARLIRTFIWPPMVAVRDFPDGRKILFYERYAQIKGHTPARILQHKNYKAFEKTFKEMKRFAESNNLTLAVVLLPSKSEVYSWVLDGKNQWFSDKRPSGFSVIVNELCRSEGLYFLDLKPFLIDETRRVYSESGELLWWHDSSHMNERGHEALASIAYNKLLRKVIAKE